MFGSKKSFQEPAENIIARRILKILQRDGLQQLTLNKNEIKIYGDFEPTNANTKAFQTFVLPLIREGIRNSDEKFRKYSPDHPILNHYIAYFIADEIMQTLLSYTTTDRITCSKIKKEENLLSLPRYNPELLEKLSKTLTNETKPLESQPLLMKQSEKGLADLIQNTVQEINITEVTEKGIEYSCTLIKQAYQSVFEKLKIAGM